MTRCFPMGFFVAPLGDSRGKRGPHAVHRSWGRAIFVHPLVRVSFACAVQ
eukprot:COSAG01_NODE_30807_length_609_cov_1.023529_1_plen_49_part_01